LLMKGESFIYKSGSKTLRLACLGWSTLGWNEKNQWQPVWNDFNMQSIVKISQSKWEIITGNECIYYDMTYFHINKWMFSFFRMSNFYLNQRFWSAFIHEKRILLKSYHKLIAWRRAFGMETKCWVMNGQSKELLFF